MELNIFIKKIGLWLMFLIVVVIITLICETGGILLLLGIPIILGVLVLAIHVTYSN